MRLKALLLLTLCFFMMGCSDDVASEVVEGDENRKLRPAPIPTTTLPCNGCKADGECLPGKEKAACGAGGSACTECRGDNQCNDEGECSTPPACSAENCEGCCMGDECLAGDDASGCGMGGSICEACAEDATCSAGRCNRECGPDTCTGCCDDTGACVGGTDASACGVGGGACGPCAAGATCSAGACVSQACADTCAGCCMGETCIETPNDAACGPTGGACVACADAQACVAGTCQQTNVTSWDIIAVSADVNDYYDAFSLPDPYVEGYTEDSTYYWSDYTSTIGDTLSPVWNEAILRDVSDEALQNGLALVIYDEDVFGSETICGYSFGPLPPEVFTGGLLESPCQADPSTKLRWRVVPHVP